jgi:hypothetical protein
MCDDSNIGPHPVVSLFGPHLSEQQTANGHHLQEKSLTITKIQYKHDIKQTIKKHKKHKTKLNT